jgi:hypothetical protein
MLREHRLSLQSEPDRFGRADRQGNERRVEMRCRAGLHGGRMPGRQATLRPEGGRMGEQEDRTSFDIDAGGSVPVGPGHVSSFDSTTLDFGHHAGRKIADLATEDPDYLRWLARHPSGVRYRAEIQRVLASAVPRAGDWQR